MAAVLYKTPSLKELIGINALAGVEGIGPARMRIPNAGSSKGSFSHPRMIREYDWMKKRDSQDLFPSRSVPNGGMRPKSLPRGA